MWGTWRPWWVVTLTWSMASRWMVKPIWDSSTMNEASTKGWLWFTRRGREELSRQKLTSIYNHTSSEDRWMWRHTARYPPTQQLGSSWCHCPLFCELNTGCRCSGKTSKLVLQEPGLECCSQQWGALAWRHDLARHWLQTWRQTRPVTLWGDDGIPNSGGFYKDTFACLYKCALVWN